MICKAPYVKNGHAYGCGQCMPCRINRQRVWAHRITLEASLYEDNAFVTLTYADEHLPEGSTLVPRHLQLFLKRVRKSGSTFRYYAVGEYGTETERPHYHLAMFGYPACRRGVTQIRRSGHCCPICQALQEMWGYGQIYSGQVTPQSAAYIAGYVTKKMTKPDDPRLGTRFPEFARMSLKPGIGAHMMDEVAHTILSHGLEEQLEDVPAALRHGSVQMPLGRYLRRRLRERIGRSANAPEIVLARMEEEMRPLRESAFANSQNGFKQEGFRQAIIEASMGKIIQREGRYKLKRKVGVL